MEQETGARRTFVIHILNQQNATWQGTVTWLDGKQTRPFRSALELIRLMDGVIGQDHCNRRGHCERYLYRVWQQ